MVDGLPGNLGSLPARALWRVERAANVLHRQEVATTQNHKMEEEVAVEKLESTELKDVLQREAVQVEHLSFDIWIKKLKYTVSALFRFKFLFPLRYLCNSVFEN